MLEKFNICFHPDPKEAEQNRIKGKGATNTRTHTRTNTFFFFLPVCKNKIKGNPTTAENFTLTKVFFVWIGYTAPINIRLNIPQQTN